MVKTLIPVGLIRNVVAPAWILMFGLAFLSDPAMGVAASVSLFVVGVLVVPVLMLGARPLEQLAAAAEPAAHD